MQSLRGKNAILTGGSKGLGPYIGRALAREGVNLALAARTESSLKEVAEELAGLNVETLAVAADMTKDEDQDRLVETVNREFGGIDLLINNAGVEWVSRYTSLTEADIRTLVQTNLLAPLLLTRKVLPQMLKNKSGHVVTMSSLGGKKGSPFSATYAATKAGLIEWTSGIREELRGTGVSASVVCPGFVAEAGMFAVYGKKAPKITGETTPEKVAGAVVRAIREDRGEIVVTPGAIKPMQVLDAINPAVGTWILRTFGVYKFYREQAEENEKSLV